MSAKRDWLQGSIQPLLLTMIFEHPMYGYQIVREMESRSEGYFNFKEGTLYPVLHRLEEDGYIVGEWRQVGKGRQRKYYHITKAGRAHLAEKRAEWRDLQAAIALITKLPHFDAGR